MWLNILTLILFSIELILSSIGINGYLGSFFFWLDLLSTLSIITDIHPFWDAIVGVGVTQEETIIEDDLSEHDGKIGRYVLDKIGGNSN